MISKLIRDKSSVLTNKIEKLDGCIMNILVCTKTIPYLLTSGDNLRIHNIFSILSKSHNVYLLYNNSEENQRCLPYIKNIGIFKDCIALSLPGGTIYDRTFSLILSGSKVNQDWGLYKHKYLVNSSLHEIIEKYQIDIIHSNFVFMNLLISDFYDVPKVLDLTDSHSLYYKRELFRCDSLIDFCFNLCRFMAFRIGERNLMNQFDKTTVVSSVDQAYLQKLDTKVPVTVIPNGVDTNYFSKINTINEDYPSILFSGNMSFPPNIDAVLYIYSKILPLIKLQIPNVKFYIVGTDPSPVVKNLHDGKNIIVTGFVDDIRQYICRGSVILVPMRKGGGLKNKILEAMAMEKPVVTNSMGAESFNDDIKNCLFIGNTEQELSNQVINLLQDTEARSQSGTIGRKIILDEYSWDFVAKKYEQLYLELLN